MPGTVLKDFLHVLVCFVLLQQNITDWIIYKENKFISYSSRGWEVLKMMEPHLEKVPGEGLFPVL